MKPTKTTKQPPTDEEQMAEQAREYNRLPMTMEVVERERIYQAKKAKREGIIPADIHGITFVNGKEHMVECLCVECLNSEDRTGHHHSCLCKVCNERVDRKRRIRSSTASSPPTATPETSIRTPEKTQEVAQIPWLPIQVPDSRPLYKLFIVRIPGGWLGRRGSYGGARNAR